MTRFRGSRARPSDLLFTLRREDYPLPAVGQAFPGGRISTKDFKMLTSHLFRLSYGLILAQQSSRTIVRTYLDKSLDGNGICGYPVVDSVSVAR